MTHDELLARIKEGQWVDRDEMHLRSNALRAVVALEKVVPSFTIDKELYEMPIDTALQIAYANGFLDSREKVIQAIEKELK